VLILGSGILIGCSFSALSDSKYEGGIENYFYETGNITITPMK
jgi:hypothetical protein